MAKADEYIASPVIGELIFPDGSPAANIEVKRSWWWRGRKGSDLAKTDIAGKFTLPEVRPKWGLLDFLPSDDSIAQVFVAYLPDGEFEFLNVDTDGFDLFAETNGKPFNVRCTMNVKQGKDDVQWGTCQLLG